MLPVGPGGFSETNYIDHTTERQEELMEGEQSPQSGRKSMPSCQQEERLRQRRPGCRFQRGRAVECVHRLMVHAGHLVNLHRQSYETSFMKSLYQ